MKKIIRIAICIAILLPLAFGTQSFIDPDPAPEPNLTRYYFVPRKIPGTQDYYYDVKFSIYKIAHDGFSWFNEGPYYPDEYNTTTESSQWLISYLTATYAEVWGKRYSFSNWVNLGTISCSSYNTDVVSGKITKFTIDMIVLPQEQ